jgi:hypothetical protein
VCFFLVVFYAFFFHVKKFAVADIGLRLFSVKRFLYSLNYSSRITNLRGIPWYVKENYVCWYSSLCLLPQHILWPRDAGNKPCSRLAHRKTKLHFWPSLLILLVPKRKISRMVSPFPYRDLHSNICGTILRFYVPGINNMPPAVTQFLHFLISYFKFQYGGRTDLGATLAALN